MSIPGRRTQLAAEGVLIVVSILLAFAIDTWWDDRGRAAEERALITDLAAELRSNVHDLDSIAHRHGGFSALIAVLVSATDAEVRAIPSDSAAMFQAAMASASTFDAQIGTIDGAIASGKLGLLSDAPVRGMVTAWRGEVDDAREQSGILIEASDRVLNALSRHGGPWIGGPRMSAEDLLRIRRDDELMAFVRVKLTYAYFYVQQLDRMGALARETITSLEDQ